MSVRIEKYYEDGVVNVYSVLLKPASANIEIEFARVDKTHNKDHVKAQVLAMVTGYWQDTAQLIEIQQALMKTIELMQDTTK